MVSADSHPVSGAFTFSIGKPSPPRPRRPRTTPNTRSPRASTTPAATSPTSRPRAALGTAAFAALCRPPDTGPLRAPLLFGWWTLLVTTAALLILRAPYEKGTSPGTALDVSAFPDTVSGRPAWPCCPVWLSC